MAYTNEEIELVCKKASETMKDFTSVQNCTFPTTAIINGMIAEKTAEEISEDAYNSIAGVPLSDFRFGTLLHNGNIKNVAQYMQGVILSEIKRIDATK